MKIKHQEVLKYVPVANIIIMFLLIRAYQKNVTRPFQFALVVLKTFGYLILINIPRMVLHYIGVSEIATTVLYWATVHFCLFAIALVSINEQKKIKKVKGNC